MSKSLEKKKVTTTKNKKVVKEKSEKVEKVKQNRIKKLTKKQLIIIGSIFAACILVAAISISLLIDNKELEPEIKTCLVQFNTNGGLEIEAASLECGGTIKEPETPKKDGFTFLGWYLNDKEYDFESKIDNNVILEAKWEAKEDIKIVVVSFDTAGGSKQADIEVEKGTYLTKPVDPTKKGYTFIGWYLGDKKFSFDKNEIEKNITLIAKWKKNQSTNDQNMQSSSTKPSSSNDIPCRVSILSGASDKTVFTGYHGHFSTIWNAALVVWTDDQCLVKHSSSDTSVATISSKGIVDTKNTGVTILSACVTDKSTKTEMGCFSAKLEVQKNTIKPPTSIKCFDSTVEIGDDVGYLTRSWGGLTTSMVNIPYFDNYFYITEAKSSDNSILKIISNEHIGYKPLKQGKVKLTLTTNTGLTGSCYVKVVKKRAKSVKITDDYENVYVGDVIQLNAKITPEDATEEFFWESEDPDIAAVDRSGKLTALKTGHAIIEVFNEEKTISDTISIYISGKAVKEVSLNKNNIYLNTGDTELLTATIIPSDAANKNVTWSSSNNDVATVSSSGRITAKSEGTAIITAKTNDGGYTDKCTVTVSSIKVNSISLNKTSISLIKGNGESLTATILPNNATNKNVTWSSSDTSVATVSNSGKVTAVKKGIAIITATTEDGGYTASCEVTVTNPPLTASASVGVQTSVSSSGAARYIVVSVGASGGTGTYTYYSIKIYKDGTYIGTNDDTTQNKIYLTGNPNGNYKIEYEVRDSDGTVITGTSNSTISGF